MSEGMSDDIERVVVATVAEASLERRYNAKGEEKEYWSLRLDVPAISQFPLPMSMPRDDIAGPILKGSTHTVVLRRGRLKKDKTGERDTDYWWDLAEWDTTKAVPTPTVGSSPRPEDGLRRSAEEMRWTEALHIAAELLSHEINEYGTFMESAKTVYDMIMDGPPPALAPEEAPASSDQSPPPSAIQIHAVVDNESEWVCIRCKTRHEINFVTPTGRMSYKSDKGKVCLMPI